MLEILPISQSSLSDYMVLSLSNPHFLLTKETKEAKNMVWQMLVGVLAFGSASLVSSSPLLNGSWPLDGLTQTK